MKTPGTNLALLYKRWGRRVFEAHGAFWMNTDPDSRVFVPVLDHGDFHLTAAESAEVLRPGGGLVLRYPTNTQPGLPGGAYVCRDPGYGMHSLAKRMRNYVRRGMERCEIRPATLDELLGQGLELNRDTDARHGRRRGYFCDEKHWATTAAAVFDSPGAFNLAAFVDGRLASYEIGVLDGEWAYALIQMSRTDMLEHHPNHALDYQFNLAAFQQPGIRGVCIGPLPLRVNEGLHNYKLRMGFEIQPSRTALRLHPAAAWIGESALAGRAVRLARRLPGMAERLEGLEIVVTGSRLTAEKSMDGVPSFSPLAEQTRETL